MAITHCIIYTRFSPRPDAATSESCEVQRQICRDFAARKGWRLEGTFDDPDRSGSDEFRDKLWNCIKTLKKDWVLLVYKRDRLARDVYLSALIDKQVREKGARIVAISGDVEGDSPETVLIRQVVAAMAEYERKCISARTRAAMRALQAKGRKMSAVIPYGWRESPDDPKMMVKDEREQAVIEKIMQLRDSGMGYRAVAIELNKGEDTQARCGTWYPNTIRQIVSRERQFKE